MTKQQYNRARRRRQSNGGSMTKNQAQEPEPTAPGIAKVMNTLIALRIIYFCLENKRMQKEIEDQIKALQMRLGMKCLT
jgi:hypothetical protein